jgi:hypothetical protein
MALKLKVVIVKPGLWGLTKKDLRDAGREAIQYAGLYWHEHYKGLHFQVFAIPKYGYQRNTHDYERRKKREHPEAGGRPMVYSGESERRAMASDKVRATAKSWEAFHADVVIDAPALNYRRLHDQMTKTTPAEELVLANEFARKFTSNFLAIGASRMETIRLTAG